MKRKALTDTWLRTQNGKITDTEITVSDGNALHARLRNGVISFIFRPVLKDGTRIKLTLGRYPETSLKKARDAATKYRAIVEAGGDPRKAKKAEIELAITEPTVDDVFDYWFEHYCLIKRSKPDTIKKNYKRHLGAKFGDLYYKDLSRQQVLAHAMKRIEKTPIMVSKVLSEFSQATTYAIDHNFLQHPNVLAGISNRHLGVKRGKGSRILNQDEIRVFYQALNQCNQHERNDIILRLLLIYGCRGGELRQTRRDWLDLDRGLWSVPWQYHKTGSETRRPLIRPITKGTRALWERALELSPSSDYVFTNIKGKTTLTADPMTSSALLNLPVTLERWINNKMKDENGQPVRIEHFSNHDLRRTARSFWPKWAEWALCEKMLGHALPGDADTYDYFEYADKMRPVYDQWFDLLQKLEHGQGAEVVKIEDKKAAN